MSENAKSSGAQAPLSAVVANDALWLLRFMAGAALDEWLGLPSADQRKAWRDA